MKNSIITKDGVSYLIPFILITSCFALWGFANDITNPMVKAFSKIFRMSVTVGAGCLLWRLLCDGISGGDVHPQVLL